LLSHLVVHGARQAGVNPVDLDTSGLKYGWEGSVQKVVGSRGHCQLRLGAGDGFELLAEPGTERAIVDRASNLQQ
jgi:hypothetical protein